MAVIRDGIEATRRVDYDAPELRRDRRGARRRAAAHRGAVGLDVPEHDGRATSGLFDPDYYEDLMMPAVPRGHHRRGAGAARHRPVHAAGHRRGQGQGPVPRERPGVPRRRCAPAAWSAPWSARTPRSPTRSTRSTTCCSPRSTGSRPPRARSDGAAPGQVYGIAERVREAYRQQGRAAVPRGRRGRGGRPRDDPVAVRTSSTASSPSSPPTRSRAPGRSSTPWRRSTPGTGGLFAATIDPWKCTGCLECIDVCGPDALTAREQDADVLGTLQERFEFMSADAEHADPVHRGLRHPGRRHQAADARPRQLLRDHRRPRRLPRLRRGDRHPAGHVDQSTPSATRGAASTSASSRPRRPADAKLDHRSTTRTRRERLTRTPSTTLERRLYTRRAARPATARRPR